MTVMRKSLLEGLLTSLYTDKPMHYYSKRYEARMIFKIGELLLSDIDHTRVAQELDKRILIADLESSGIHEYARRPLRTLQDDFSSIDKLVGKWKWDGKNPVKEKKELKAIVMEHSEPLADMYLKHCVELFDVFQNLSSKEEVLFERHIHAI